MYFKKLVATAVNKDSQKCSYFARFPVFRVKTQKTFTKVLNSVL